MKKYGGVGADSLRLKHVLYTKGKWKATITINRPEVHNALNFEILMELGRVL